VQSFSDSAKLKGRKIYQKNTGVFLGYNNSLNIKTLLKIHPDFSKNKYELGFLQSYTKTKTIAPVLNLKLLGIIKKQEIWIFVQDIEKLSKINMFFQEAL
jgi:hypothetical protein